MAPEADRTTCRHPSCFKTFKGERGLRIHLGIVKKCGNWYARLRRKKPPSNADQPDSEVESVLSSANTSLTSGYSFKLPWSFIPKPVFGEIRNPSGIPLPWLSKLRKHRPEPSQFVSDKQTLADDLDANAPPTDVADDTFLCFAGEDDPQVFGAAPNSNRVDSFPGAAEVIEDGLPFLEQIKNDRASVENECGLFYPFKSVEDFTLAAWLSNSGASMSSIDKFLQLPFVS